MNDHACPICGHSTRVITSDDVPEWKGLRECTVCSWLEDGPECSAAMG